MSKGRSVDQKRELIRVLIRETVRIMKTEQEKVRILIYEVSGENWGDAGPFNSSYNYSAVSTAICNLINSFFFRIHFSSI
ncbi:MAG: tautomerase family protein [Thermoproteota archaeon]|nr:tautomerase family protein [Thermoproteota archaeon]